MEKHTISSNTRAFQLLTRLLTIDPVKRLSGKTILHSLHAFLLLVYLALDAMNDTYFKDDPRPTEE